MKKRLSRFVGLSLALVLCFAVTSSAVAQDKKAKEQNIQGTVKEIKRAASTLTVDDGKAQRQVMYSASTKFMTGHSDDSKAGSLDKLDLGKYVSCVGSMDKGVLMATSCIYRDKK